MNLANVVNASKYGILFPQVSLNTTPLSVASATTALLISHSNTSVYKCHDTNDLHY